MPPPFQRLLAKGCAHRNLDKTYVVDLTCECKYLGTLDFSEPMELNHSHPLRMMGNIGKGLNVVYVGRLTHISGLCREWRFDGGLSTNPCIELINAVSSLQTNAPAPRRSSMSKSNPLPRISLPRRPYSRACLMAISRRRIARGYSALI